MSLLLEPLPLLPTNFLLFPSVHQTASRLASWDHAVGRCWHVLVLKIWIYLDLSSGKAAKQIGELSQLTLRLHWTSESGSLSRHALHSSQWNASTPFITHSKPLEAFVHSISANARDGMSTSDSLGLQIFLRLVFRVTDCQVEYHDNCFLSTESKQIYLLKVKLNLLQLCPKLARVPKVS